MKLKISTVPVVVVVIFLVSVCIIVSVVIVSNRDASFLQGYTIGVIAIIVYTGIVVSSKK
jgi:hypothetical protein